MECEVITCMFFIRKIDIFHRIDVYLSRSALAIYLGAYHMFSGHTTLYSLSARLVAFYVYFLDL